MARFFFIDFRLLAPHISQDDLQGGFRYGDAQTDDARLTLRVIREAVAEGAVAINYVKAISLVRQDGMVTGAVLADQLSVRQAEVSARVVINATGSWADELRKQAGGSPHLRPLRGSHLIFPSWRLPVAQAISFLHPFDHRPVFILPWERITLVGTTDVDHLSPMEIEPVINPDEVAYLMAAVDYRFPSLSINLCDVISTYAGVRPVIGSGKQKSSEESRDHVIWKENGLISVTGGKLTTFRRIALDVLKVIRPRLPEMPLPDQEMPVLNSVNQQLPGCEDLRDACRQRLLGRYGSDAILLVDAAQPGEMEAITGTDYLWAELRWAARSEGVCHLDDLLLRRTRLGLILARGAEDILPEVEQICRVELAWAEDRWQQELADYLALWQQNYSLPNPASVPDWKPQLNAIKKHRAALPPPHRLKVIRHSWILSGLILFGAAVLTVRWMSTPHKKKKY